MKSYSHRLLCCLAAAAAVGWALLMIPTSCAAKEVDLDDLDLASSGQTPMRHYQDIHPVKDDAPYIGCAMCKRVLRQLVSQVHSGTKTKRTTKPSELEYLEAGKNLCDPLEEEGFWLTHLDIAKEGESLVVKRKNVPGHCEEDCKTVAFTCQELLNLGESDFAERLYMNKTSIEEICAMKSLNEFSCGLGTRKLPQNWQDRGSEFRHKTAKDFAREQKIAEKLLGGGGGEQDDEPDSAEKTTKSKKKGGKKPTKKRVGISGIDGSTVEVDADGKASNLDLGNVGIMLENGEDLGPLRDLQRDGL